MTEKKNTIWITGASSGIGRSLAMAYGKDPVNPDLPGLCQYQCLHQCAHR